MSELVAAKDYIDSDNEISVSLKGSITTLRNEEQNHLAEKYLDFSSCASFASCQSYANIENTILKREVHTSNASLDSGIDLDSLMGSSSKSLHNDEPSSTTTKTRKHNLDINTKDDEDEEEQVNALVKRSSMRVVMERKSLLLTTEDEEEEEQVNALVKRSSMRVVMERKSLLLTDDSSESSEGGEIEIDEVYDKYGRWFRPIEIDETFEVFTHYDRDSDGYLDLSQFKRMLEKLDVPQTHLAAKHLMASVAGELSVKMTFCQFLLAYAKLLNRMTIRKTYLRDRQTERLAQTPAVDVSQVGVSGAKLFFEAKIAMQSEQIQVQSTPPLPPAITTQLLVKHNHPKAPSENARSSAMREQFKSAAAVFNKQLLNGNDGKD